MKKVNHIVLLTDFGTADPYVGILKGVIAQISPHVKCIDLTHEIPPGDIRRAAIFLWQSRAYFPKNSIFLCIIDPGVGTSRRAIVLRVEQQMYIGPDNGIFSFVYGSNSQAWEIDKYFFSRSPSFTFHGRDIFAPAAGYLALGHDPSEFSSPIGNLLRLPFPKLEVSSQGDILGEIIYEDRFGNLITSLGSFTWQDENTLELIPWVPVENDPPKEIDTRKSTLILPNQITLPIVHTYGDLDLGACGCLVGSSGLLEIVANQRKSSSLLGLSSGDIVTLKIQGEA